VKKRDAGEPTIIVHTLPGTPEQVARNRENLRQVCEKIMSRVAGQPMHVEINWHDETKKKENA
jgi:hypothetical protein